MITYYLSSGICYLFLQPNQNRAFFCCSISFLEQMWKPLSLKTSLLFKRLKGKVYNFHEFIKLYATENIDVRSFKGSRLFVTFAFLIICITNQLKCTRKVLPCVCVHNVQKSSLLLGVILSLPGMTSCDYFSRYFHLHFCFLASREFASMAEGDLQYLDVGGETSPSNTML